MVSQYPDAEWFTTRRGRLLAGPEYERRDRLHHNAAGRRDGPARAPGGGQLRPGPHQRAVLGRPRRPLGRRGDRLAAQLGLADGYPNDTTAPRWARSSSRITRGQFLSMLWRLQGEPDGFGPHPWSDGTARLDGALRWAAATGVGVGFDGRYRPGAPSSRGQALAMLWRLAGRPDGFWPYPWSDGTARLDGALRWAAATGVMGGYRNGTFRPDRPLSRASGAGAVPVRRALKLRVLARLPHCHRAPAAGPVPGLVVERHRAVVGGAELEPGPGPPCLGQHDPRQELAEELVPRPDGLQANLPVGVEAGDQAHVARGRLQRAGPPSLSWWRMSSACRAVRKRRARSRPAASARRATAASSWSRSHSPGTGAARPGRPARLHVHGVGEGLDQPELGGDIGHNTIVSI